MIESRCGLLFGECQYRTKIPCPGCTRMEKPFWGDSCPVKACCVGKQHAHCGECIDFPCGLLRQFAFDKEQGDDGKRITQCEAWRGGSN